MCIEVLIKDVDVTGALVAAVAPVLVVCVVPNVVEVKVDVLQLVVLSDGTSESVVVKVNPPDAIVVPVVLETVVVLVPLVVVVVVIKLSH